MNLKQNAYIFSLLIALTILCGWGCQQTMTLCPNDQVPYFNCTFSYSDEFHADTFVVTLMDLDTILYAAKIGPIALTIPLQFDKESTKFQIFYHQDTVDYFTIKHTPNVIFESPECGFVVSFTLDSLVTNSKEKIDSVYLLNPIIDQNKYENIEIAF